VVEAYRKIRNTGRYLLANLYDFDPSRDLMPLAAMQEVDRYALARYAGRGARDPRCLRRLRFPDHFQRLNQLTTVDLSAFYADVSKDRLYTFAAAATARRSAQTAMYLIATACRACSRRSFRSRLTSCGATPRNEASFVHIAEFPPRTEVQGLVDRDLVARWERLIAIRDDVNRALESARQGKTIGNSLGRAVTLTAGGATGALLRRYRDDLPMLFIVSQVALQAPRRRGYAGDRRRPRGRLQVRALLADRRRDFVEPDTDGLCDRCVDAVGGSQAA
jgi:isoleucyl-tRNA synthetase